MCTDQFSFYCVCIYLQFSASPSKTNWLAGATRDNILMCVVHNVSQPVSAEVKVILDSSPKMKFMLFQTCISVFLSVECNLLENISTVVVHETTLNPIDFHCMDQNIFICVPQKKERYTDLEEHISFIFG